MSLQVHKVTIKKMLTDPDGPVGRRLLLTGVRINNRAKRLCPVDTGRLRSSIYTTEPVRQSTHELEVQVRTNVNYARFVELGTRYMRGRSYLGRALREEFA